MVGNQVQKMLDFAAENGSITNYDAVYRLGIRMCLPGVCR